MPYAARNLLIPICDDPATHAVTYDPTGLGPRRLAFCERHGQMFTGTLTRRKTAFTVERLVAAEPCHAYKGG